MASFTSDTVAAARLAVGMPVMLRAFRRRLARHRDTLMISKLRKNLGGLSLFEKLLTSKASTSSFVVGAPTTSGNRDDHCQFGLHRLTWVDNVLSAYSMHWTFNLAMMVHRPRVRHVDWLTTSGKKHSGLPDNHTQQLLKSFNQCSLATLSIHPTSRWREWLVGMHISCR